MKKNQQNPKQESDDYVHESFKDLVKWTPKQKIASKAVNLFKFILYGGAMGGGKSYWLRWQLVKLLAYYYAKYGLDNIMVGLFCETTQH